MTSLENQLKEIKSTSEKLPSVRLRLGSNLVNKIDNLREKYGARGFYAGTFLGLTVGGILGHNLLDGNSGFDTFFGSFMGLALGANCGYAFGLKYGEHKIKKLKKQFPESANDIDEYFKLKMIQTYANVRGL